MYKSLSIALLLVVFGLVAGRSTAKSDSALTPPVIVKRVALPNQTTPIPTTTLFTPAQSGLYRVSVYMTELEGKGNSSSSWLFNLNWWDNAGFEGGQINQGFVQLEQLQKPPLAWGSSGGSAPPGAFVIQADAGKPVTYSVDVSGNDDGAYSFYLVVERLM